MADTDDQLAPIKDYYDSVAADYGDRYKKENLWSHPKYPANYFRHQILVERLAGTDARRVYEVGVGEGTPLSMLARMGFEVAGCDVSKVMVDLACANLLKAGVAIPDIIQADIEDPASFSSHADWNADVVVAFGVLPHVQRPQVMLDNVRALLAGRGRVFIEFRNALFSLFTFNRHTRHFIVDELLATVAPNVRDVVAAEVEKCVDMNSPPLSAGGEYESIRATYHNPLELEDLFAKSGFSKLRLHWYHFHPALPRQEHALGRVFREEAFKLERTTDWRGMFLCSAGVVEADAG